MLKNSLTKRIISFSIFFNLLCTKAFSQDTLGPFDTILEKAQELNQKLSFEKVIDALFSDMVSFTKSVFSFFCASFAILIISGVFSAIKNSFGKSREIFDCVSSAAFILCSVTIFETCFNKVQGHITSLCGFMVSFVPVQTALYASSGATLTSAFASTALSYAISAIEVISSALILPAIKVMCTVTLVNVLCKNVNLSGICNFLKTAILWVLGLSFTLFSGVLALQTTLNACADSLALKGIRYGASKLIPIAGGLVGDSIRTVLSSVGYVKGVTGISGMVFIIYSIIPPICAIAISKLSYLILLAFARVTSEETSAKFLDGLTNCINILLALLLGSSIAFIFMLTLFIKTTVSL